MSDLETRIEKLEQLTDPDQVRVVVNWDQDPELPGPGVRVVNWEDGETSNGQAARAMRRHYPGAWRS